MAFVPAVIGSRFPSAGYFRRLRKPSWAPPPAAFGPVWTALYATAGIAAWLVARSGRGSAGALSAWGVQLALNATWTPIFFGLRAPALALANIGLLWGALAGTIVAFWSRRRVAGALLLPYLGWVTFATALNYAIWRRNR